VSYVYTMECGCKWESSFPRTRGSRVPWCRVWAHRPAQTGLVEGPFEETRFPNIVRDRENDGWRVTPVYTVWRRLKDGYVHASAGSPANLGHPYKPHDGTVTLTGFETLLVTDDWMAAHARIVAERGVDEMELSARKSRELWRDPGFCPQLKIWPEIKHLAKSGEGS
jgi:hypothetical protein